MKRVPLLMIVMTLLASLYALALAGCGLTSVQKVKLACAESAERLAGAYRAPGAPLAKLDDAMAERSALCSDARYHAVEIGADDAASLIKKIGAIAPQK